MKAKVQSWLQTTNTNDTVGCQCKSGSPVCLYCEDCQLEVCGTCVHTHHHTHKTVSLEMNDRIGEDYVSLYADENKEKMLVKHKRDVENCASRAIEEITRQHESAMEVLFDVFNEQVKVVKQWKKDELMNLPGLYNEAEAFLLERSLKNRLEETENLDNWSYRNPQVLHGKDKTKLRRYLKQQLLGSYISSGNITHPTARQYRLPESLKSLDSGFSSKSPLGSDITSSSSLVGNPTLREITIPALAHPSAPEPRPIVMDCNGRFSLDLWLEKECVWKNLHVFS